MNIIFDLGGVLVEWNPHQMLSSRFSSQEQATLKKTLFAPNPWAEFDCGTLSPETLAKNAAAQSGIDAQRIHSLIQDIPSLIVEKKETVKILSDLLNQNHKLFALSNNPHVTVDYLEKHMRFFSFFTDAVYSCRVGVAKPNPAIFRILLERNKLVPKDCVYIDDLAENAMAANQLGMQSIVFENSGQCRNRLVELGCLT